MDVKLSEEVIAELQESFNMFDKNGDGTITPGELTILLQNMNKQITQAKVNAMIAAMDLDGNGRIDFQEFIKHARTVRKTGEELRKAFAVFDLDGNGYITEDELYEVMKKMGQNLEMAQIRKMIEAADKDSDGRINYDDFLRLMTKK